MCRRRRGVEGYEPDDSCEQRLFTPLAVNRWLVSLPSSMEELQQRAAYQANLAGLQLEQAMTDGWARYLSLRRRWLRGGTGGGGSSFSGRGAGSGGGGDARGGSGGVASERGGLHGIQEWVVAAGHCVAPAFASTP